MGGRRGAKGGGRGGRGNRNLEIDAESLSLSGGAADVMAMINAKDKDDAQEIQEDELSGNGAGASADATTKGKAKGKVKAKAAPSGKRKTRKEPQEFDSKQCKKCKESKDSGSFNKDQGICKSCFGDQRHFARLVSTQMGDGWMATTKQQDPKKIEMLEKEFQLERKVCAREERKINFSVKNVIERTSSESGTKLKVGAKMMWQGEYFEWAKTAAAGFLSDTEMKANWARWDADPSHPSDHDGPRGYKQLAVPNFDKRIEDFNLVKKAKELEFQAKLGKDVTEERLASIQQNLSRGHEKDALFSESRRSLALHAGMLSSGASSSEARLGAFDSAGMSLSLQSILDGKSPSKAQNTDAEDGVHTEGGDKNIHGKSPAGKKKHEFLPDITANRASREFRTLIDTLRSSMQEVANTANKQLNSARASAARDHYRNELRVLDSRLRCLNLVLDGGVSELQPFLGRFGKPKSSDCLEGAEENADAEHDAEVSSVSDSRCADEVVRAGPSPAMKHDHFG